jgi:hypothetical protein
MTELLKNKDYKSDALETVEYSNVVEDFSLKKHFKIKSNVSFLLFTSHTPCRHLDFFLNLKSLTRFYLQNLFTKKGGIAPLCQKLIVH